MPWGCLRAMVEPSFGERMVINHRDYLTHANIIVSYATKITKTSVKTVDGHQVDYDYLIIATGNADSFPKSRSERLRQFQEGNTKRRSLAGRGRKK